MKSDTGRSLPPGQHVVRGLPVLDLGTVPHIYLASWRLTITGLVEKPLELSWEGFMTMPMVSVRADFHCVTHWSKLDNLWEGVLFQELAARVDPSREARYVMVNCYDGFATNLPLEILLDPSVLLAYHHNNVELTAEHGWPLRLVVPQRYAWKSAKWVKGLEFMAEDRPGFWEQRGYHNDADPWKEERYS